MTKLTLKELMLYPNARVWYDNELWEINLLFRCHDTIHMQRKVYDGMIYRNANISDCRLELRTLDDMTDEEYLTLATMIFPDHKRNAGKEIGKSLASFKLLAGISYENGKEISDYLRSISVDIDGLIESGVAIRKV